jgi:DNA-binding response OmpR family regulator
MTDSLTILLLDGEKTRDLLQDLLREEGHLVVVAHDGLSARASARESAFDLAVVDADMPLRPDALAVTRSVIRDYGIPVILLGRGGCSANRVRGLDAGADDYIVRPFAAGEFLARVRVALRRAGHHAPTQWRYRDLVVDDQVYSVARDGFRVDVTPTEFRLLRALVRSRPGVVTKQELLAKVWSYESTNTNLVEYQVSRLRRKLELHGPPLIHTVRGVGYRLD